MVQTVLHLIHPIYFQFYPFHRFPFSEMSSDSQPLILLDVPTVEIYTSGGADCPAPDTSHLFSVLPFPPFPIL